MKYKRTITWILADEENPTEEGDYLIQRCDGENSIIVVETWMDEHFSSDDQGGRFDGGNEDGPVIAWAQLPKGVPKSCLRL